MERTEKSRGLEIIADAFDAVFQMEGAEVEKKTELFAAQSQIGKELFAFSPFPSFA